LNFTNRKKTGVVEVGNVKIGGDNPISIQSMTNTDTKNIEKTTEQILELEKVGCEIIRLAVKDSDSVKYLKEIIKNVNIPVVADIHFDYRIALDVMDAGVSKLRINPGNIGDMQKIKLVVNKALDKNIPIRIGVNAGSLEKEILQKYKGVTPEGIVESAYNHVKILEDLNFHNIIVSLKSSDVNFSIKSYELISKMIDYPLHVGITEAGTLHAGTIKSAVGIGAILSRGIGDTIRVSLTDEPIREIECAKEILKSLGLRKFGIEFVSCPTCGRTEIDLINLAKTVEMKCKDINKNIKVAVMGCVVNGPGEAKEADIGICGGKGVGMIIKKGEIIKKVKEENLVDELIKEINAFEC